MSETEIISLIDGQTLLVIVENNQVVQFTWDMALPHAEFVRRTVGLLPHTAWVGTVSKLNGQVTAISSKHFFGYQMPAPKLILAAVLKQFK